jgi:hypothetical protein
LENIAKIKIDISYNWNYNVTYIADVSDDEIDRAKVYREHMIEKTDGYLEWDSGCILPGFMVVFR